MVQPGPKILVFFHARHNTHILLYLFEEYYKKNILSNVNILDYRNSLVLLVTKKRPVYALLGILFFYDSTS